jgi:hypothetical protein
MGLDAVVYKNIENLPEPLKGQVKLVDPQTGELEFVNGPTLSLRTEDLFAADVRIGNISGVAWLREQIESRWADKCLLILNAVLYSSTHSGDFIPLDQVRRIKLEIAGIDGAEGSLPARLAAFFEQMTQLVNAAESEGNPIAFQ